jgi:hypothetical protein
MKTPRYNERAEAIDMLSQGMDALRRKVRNYRRLGPERPDSSDLERRIGRTVERDMLRISAGIMSMRPLFRSLGLAEWFEEQTGELCKELGITIGHK